MKIEMKSKMKNAIIVLPFSFVMSFLFAGLFFAGSVLADPQIQVTSTVSPNPVAPGSDGYTQLAFTNTGTSAASSIQIIGVSSDPSISVSSNVVGNLGSLGAGQSTTALVKFSVSGSAASGLYTIRFQINYCTSSCNEIDPNVVVTVQTPSVLEVTSIQPSTLSAGQTTSLNFNIVNYGNDKISNIVMTWSTPNNEILPLGTSNRQYIASINGGSTLTIPINVSVAPSTSSGVYPLSVQLSYHDKSGLLQNFSSSIGINVGGTTDFDVGLQQYSAGTLSLSIANIGVNPATSVSVSIPQQSNFAVSGADTVFLGTLNSGDFSVANFQITSRLARNFNGGSSTSTQDAASSNMLTVDVTYSDTSGVRQTVEKQVTVDLASSLANGTATRSRGFLGLSTLEWIGIIVVAVIAGVALWYFKFRKRKNFLSDFIAKRFKRSS